MHQQVSGERTLRVIAQEGNESDRKWQSVDQSKPLDSDELPDLQSAELHQRMRRNWNQNIDRTSYLLSTSIQPSLVFYLKPSCEAAA